jgi:hypothetical protein
MVVLVWGEWWLGLSYAAMRMQREKEVMMMPPGAWCSVRLMRNFVDNVMP